MAETSSRPGEFSRVATKVLDRGTFGDDPSGTYPQLDNVSLTRLFDSQRIERFKWRS